MTNNVNLLVGGVFESHDNHHHLFLFPQNQLGLPLKIRDFDLNPQNGEIIVSRDTS